MKQRRASTLGRALGAVLRREAPPFEALPLLWSWVATGSAATVLATLADVVIGAQLGLVAVASALGLAVLVGAGVGAGLAALSFLGSRLPPRLSSAPWVAVALVVWAALGQALDVPANLGGRYRSLAIAALAASLALAVAVTAPGVLLQPRGSASPSWLAARGPRLRWSFVALLVLAAAAFSFVDRTQFPNLYLAAHRALRWGTLVSLTFAGVASGHALQRPRGRALGALGAALFAVVLLPFWLLHQVNRPETAALARRPFAEAQLELLRWVTDWDRDGYSNLLGGGDCAAFDSAVNPGSAEIPTNGVDDNCVLGDGKNSANEVEDIPLPPSPSPVNVVLITIDTLRPDRMSAYGYRRATTPEIKRWAQGARRFDAAYTSGGWTTLAIPSLLLGYYPRRLQWNPLVETTKYRALRPPLDGKLEAGEAPRASFLLPIDDPRPALATLLQRRGMRTTAIVDGGFTQVFEPEWGFGRGFDEYRQIRSLDKRQRDDAGTARQAIEVLGKRSTSAPFFLWVHFFGPHAPSSRHRGIPEFGQRESDKYDHEVAFVDRQVGAVLKAVRGIQERPTAVVLTSDHGERFYNAHSRGHGRDAAEDSLRIPLFISGPGIEPGVSSELVSLVDVFPTILGLTGTPGPKHADGLNLAGSIPERTLFVDTFVRKADGVGYKMDLAVALRGDHKLVRDRVKQTVELNRRSDRSHPAKNLLPDHPDPALQEALDRYLESTGGPPRVVEP